MNFHFPHLAIQKKFKNFSKRDKKNEKAVKQLTFSEASEYPDHYYQEIKNFLFQFSIPDIYAGISDYQQLPVLLEISTFVV